MSPAVFGGNAILEHVDRHGKGRDEQRQDYYRLRIRSQGGEVIVYLTPSQLSTISMMCDEAQQDRDEGVYGRALERSLSVSEPDLVGEHGG